MIRWGQTELPLSSRAWRIAEWLLFVIWVAAAIVAMYPALRRDLHVPTFFTSYAADLTNPAWLYIVLRRRPDRNPLTRWIARSPESTAACLIIGGALSEVSQIFWPRGFFAGTFDPLDLVAYAVSLLPCYLLDKKQS